MTHGASIRPTIKRIAQVAGVSRGTVDRALNNRGDVNSEVAARIRRIADELGYAPHRAAKALRLNHTPRTIGVLLPTTSSNFFKQLETGVERGTDQFVDMGIRATVDWFGPANETELVSKIEAMQKSGVAGLVVTGPETERVRAAVLAVVEAGVPVVTTNSDISGTDRLTFVGQDLFKSGEVAAELMAKLIRDRSDGHGRIIALTGSLDFKAHRDRVAGFKEGLSHWAPEIEVEIVQGRDNYEDSRAALNTVSPDGVTGLFAATGSVQALLELRREHQEWRNIHVITNDDLPVVREGLKSGEIDFTILQDPEFQGSEPIRIISEYLLTGTRPESEWIRTPIVVAGLTLV